VYDFNDLFYFVQVVENKGFAAAARKIEIPKTKLSRRIAQLEGRLGVRLIHRTTRKFTVTEIGLDYYRHCVAMLVEADAAEKVVQRSMSEPQGIVRISCPPALGAMGVSDTFAKFMVLHPKVQIQVESTNRRVDVLGEGYDIALRVRFPPLDDENLVMKVFGDSHQKLVVRPELVAGRAIKTPEDLVGLPSVDLAQPNRDHRWAFIGPDNTRKEVSHQPRYVTADLDALLRAAVAGVGAVQMPEIMVRHSLHDGLLIELLPDYRMPSALIHAVFPSRRGLLPSVRGLIDLLADDFGANAEADREACERAGRAIRASIRPDPDPL
jgi:DNA-binding transcriptional LysR family regulator